MIFKKLIKILVVFLLVLIGLEANAQVTTTTDRLFVRQNISLRGLRIDSLSLDPNFAAGSNNVIVSQLAVKLYIANVLSLKANLLSPHLTGTPTVPDLATSDSSGTIVNSKFVKQLVAAAVGVTNLSLGTVTATTAAIANTAGTGLTLPASTSSLAGLMSALQNRQLDSLYTRKLNDTLLVGGLIQHTVSVGGKDSIYVAITAAGTTPTQSPKDSSLNLANTRYTDQSVGVLHDSIGQVADYVIEKIGTTIYARPRLKSGLAAYSGTDASTIFQDAVNGLPTSGGTISLSSQTFLLNTQVSWSIPIHWIGTGVQRYTDGSNFDFNAGTTILTHDATGITAMQANSGGSSATFHGSTVEGIGFRDSTNKSTMLSMKLINNFRIINCSFSHAHIGLLVDAQTDDASWGEVNNCIFAFNDTGIDNTNNASTSTIPNLRVSGGMFVVNTNQVGFHNKKGQYVRLDGFKMDIKGNASTGILWTGGSKGTINNVQMELDVNNSATVGIEINPTGTTANLSVPDLEIIGCTMNSDGGAGILIDVNGGAAANPTKGVKIIGGAYAGGVTGVHFGAHASDNTINSTSFYGFSTSAVTIDAGAVYTTLVNVTLDRDAGSSGGIVDNGTNTSFYGCSWVNGGSYGPLPDRGTVGNTSQFNAVGLLKTGQNGYNTTLGYPVFYNGTAFVSYSGISGQTTLVSGTKAITITGLTTSSKAQLTLVTPSGTSSTINYQAVCTTNTLTIQADVAAGTINVADGSTLNYFIPYN